MTKRIRRILLFGLFATLTGAWLLWPRPTTAITRENAERIKLGMTIAEVEAILGGPARDDNAGPIEVDDPGKFPSWARMQTRGGLIEGEEKIWRSDTVQIWLGFADHCVIVLATYNVHRSEESPIDTFRRWLHL